MYKNTKDNVRAMVDYLEEFEAWGGASTTMELIRIQGKLLELAKYLCILEKTDGRLSDTAINDFIALSIIVEDVIDWDRVEIFNNVLGSRTILCDGVLFLEKADGTIVREQKKYDFDIGRLFRR